ncbi:sulfite exporter TauE/SafE family protein [Romeria aff. gracilis LEGE 07310]|uniref:Probable membrane transporter protein n=1 Tax=Vasconcelosia minhoensis LEGE 07310 TaxID=915328 RepID=A0A8J7AL04_9CYAN|nr:sulfite exporter TauE/SafE family protein [Romeria gracilis]MBE9079678.1 sulfite exporter TauE/SafE family protein [Romeria aff. gracilis LEGE 07310]
MLETIICLSLGLAVGSISGLIGIGGGVLVTPALIYLLGYSQHQAQGTTLALLVPPIGILGAWTYYQRGYVDVRVAALICLGFVLGGLLGAKIAIAVPATLLRRSFGTSLLLVGLRMIFSSD